MKENLSILGLAVAITMILVSCGESGQVEAAKSAVRNVLIDPSSAQFSEIHTLDETTCGFVNSKNSLGGYVGKRPWVTVAEHSTVLGTPAEIAELAEFGATEIYLDDNLRKRWAEARTGCAAVDVWNNLCGREQGLVLTPYVQACSKVPGLS